MQYILRVYKNLYNADGRLSRSLSLGYIVNNSQELFPRLVQEGQNATKFETNEDASNFVINYASDFMADKKAAEEEFIISVFEHEVHMKEV